MLGHIIALAFAVRVLGIASVPPLAPPMVTATYLVLLVALVSLSTVGVLPSELLHWDAELVLDDLQLWRIVSAFFWFERPSSGLAFQLWIFGTYSSLLERRHFVRCACRYAAILCAGAAQILMFTAALGMTSASGLAHALCFYVVGLWSRSDPERSASVLNLVSMRAAYVPSVLVCMSAPVIGLEGATLNLVGVVAALGIEAAFGLPVPVLEGSAAAALSAGQPDTSSASNSSSAGTTESVGHGGTSNMRHLRGAGKASASSPSKGNNKAHAKHAALGRDGWIRWAAYSHSTSPTHSPLALTVKTSPSLPPLPSHSPLPSH